jgi:hypothetical protein
MRAHNGILRLPPSGCNTTYSVAQILMCRRKLLYNVCLWKVWKYRVLSIYQRRQIPEMRALDTHRRKNAKSVFVQEVTDDYVSWIRPKNNSWELNESKTQYALSTDSALLYSFSWVIPRRLNFICQRFETFCLFHLHMRIDTYPPMKMEQTECSETLTYKIQTTRNYPEESIQHSEHGESLRSCFVLSCGRSVHIKSVLASKFPSQHFFTLLPSCGLKIQTVLRHLSSHIISKYLLFLTLQPLHAA